MSDTRNVYELVESDSSVGASLKENGKVILHIPPTICVRWAITMLKASHLDEWKFNSPAENEQKEETVT